MACKNCNNVISEQDNFCRDCGAQVIKHRLTLKYLFSEFYQSFFSIDSNKPLLTFVDLFKKPEDVIGGYINGVRKKYVHAFGYFTIAVTITTLFYFVALKFFPNNFAGVLELVQIDRAQIEFGKKIQNSIFQYQTLFLFLSIPFLAMISWIVFFNKRKYNYAENLIINLYCYSHISIISILLFCVTIWKSKWFGIASISSMGLQAIYYSYVLKRLYKLSIAKLFIKILLFVLLLMLVYIIGMIIVLFILYSTGGLDELLEAERAKSAISYIVSSAINCTS